MEKLKKVLVQDDTILFIGSGVSMWSGLPSWTGMIEKLALFIESSGANSDLVRAEAKKGELLQAASYGFDKLTKPQICEFIKESCQYGTAKPHEIHKKIVSLGPNYFITTNYDNLIEEALRKWQLNRFYRPPVTNRHLTETARIVHARATDIIFKPHGDAADCESIILTQQQYGQLLPNGERHAALESLKMLLASRPVVYIGFGLRDPDFLYLRDLLANIYKGGTIDHYAIMSDISEEESGYWRRNYGIHLINYTTTENPDKSRNHNQLLDLLDTLLDNEFAAPKEEEFDPCSYETVLTLARHAASLSRTPKNDPEFKIRVHSKRNEKNRFFFHNFQDEFNHQPVMDFLSNGPERALLVGLPGAGKTYSFRQATAQLANELYQTCLLEPFDKRSAILPILVDLKLYAGNLRELVDQTLPKSLPFDELIQNFNVKIFLDSFNEMPREYLDNDNYELDFVEFTSNIGDASLIIGSRTSDGLGKLELPEYYLDQIDEDIVKDELQRLGISVEGRFNHEIQQLFQKPFYFQFYSSGKAKLPKEAHPRDLYQQFFDNLHKEFIKRFNSQFEITKVLSLAAFDALNKGEEAFPLSDLLTTLETSANKTNFPEMDVRDVANWLVSISIIIPYSGGRIAFVHQSITEYLAATELARQYLTSPHILKEKLSLTRWDQALFLTLSLLPPIQAQEFLENVVNIDFTLALRAVKYLEVNRDEVVSTLLDEIIKREEASNSDNHKTSWTLEQNLPITDVHEPQLRKLIKLGNSLGGAAIVRLVKLKNSEVKEEILNLLIDKKDDFNFCSNGIAKALKPFVTDNDAKQIAEWSNTLQKEIRTESEIEEKMGGFISGAGSLLSALDLSIIRREFLPSKESAEIPEINAKILCNILYHHHSTAGLILAGELLLRGVNEAVTAIDFTSNHNQSDTEISWASFTENHIECIENILQESSSSSSWAYSSLKSLCAARPDLADIVKQRALNKTGVDKAVLLNCVSPNDFTPMFNVLNELTETDDNIHRKELIRLIKDFKLDWNGKEKLFVQLLKLRDKNLAEALFGGSLPIHIENLGKIDIGPINWWLEWMQEINTQTQSEWFLSQFAGVFALHLKNEVQNKFIVEFNNSSSEFRNILLHFILPHFKEISSKEFSEDAISYMLADLSRTKRAYTYHGYLLGTIATEQFVTRRLLPLLPDAKQPLLKNLHEILDTIGSRHGKRYLV